MKAQEKPAKPVASTAETASPPPFVAKFYLLTLNPWLQLIVLALAALLVYGNTLDAPFYLDDFSSIRENPAIYQQQGLASLWQYAPLRIVVYGSLYLNYASHQFGPAGYHIVNIGIHILAAWALLWLLRGLLQTPALRERGISPWLPLLAALIFLLHPLHIQAVTYIVQRLASSAALFYLAALACFVHARLAQAPRIRYNWLAATAVCALLAFFSKQNTFTLPLALLLIEALFFSHSLRYIVKALVLTGAGLLLAWILVALVMGYQPFSLASMQALSQETDEISRTTYLATQMPALWLYLRLFFLPYGFHIDHDFPLYDFSSLIVIIALLAHVAVLVSAFMLRRRWPLISFALLFYYLAHSVESSVIPIRDVFFEHRAYLPDAGLSLLLAALLLAVPKLDKRIIAAVSIVLCLALAAMSWQRNQLWRDPVRLWQSNTVLSPDKARPWAVLGKHLLQAKRVEEGARALERSIELQRQQKNRVNITDVVNLIVAFKMQGLYRSLGFTEIEPYDGTECPEAWYPYFLFFERSLP